VQERAEATRRSLLEAAAHLFNERGYAGTSISDISELSGRTSGAIYFHYTNKENLALAVVEEHFATWPGLIGQCTTSDVPALEKLVRLSFTVARAFRDDVVVRAGARLWSERKAIDVALPPPFVGWIDTVGELLAQARAEGELAPAVDPPRAARSIVCAFFGVHTVSDALDGRLDIEEHLSDLWSLLLISLQARPDPPGLLRRAAGPLPDRVRQQTGQPPGPGLLPRPASAPEKTSAPPHRGAGRDSGLPRP
jgi:AcrR family transcriptional regulator